MSVHHFFAHESTGFLHFALDVGKSGCSNCFARKNHCIVFNFPKLGSNASFVVHELSSMCFCGKNNAIFVNKNSLALRDRRRIVSRARVANEL